MSPLMSFLCSPSFFKKPQSSVLKSSGFTARSQTTGNGCCFLGWSESLWCVSAPDSSQSFSPNTAHKFLPSCDHVLQIYTDLFVRKAPPPPFYGSCVKFFTLVEPNGNVSPPEQQEFRPFMATGTNVQGQFWSHFLIRENVLEFHTFHEHHPIKVHMLFIQNPNKHPLCNIWLDLGFSNW